MKKSICTSGFKDWPIEKVLDWMVPLRIDGVELWMGHIERYREEHGPLDKLSARLEELNLAIPIISGYTTFSGGFSGERDMKQEFSNLRRLLDVARQLGSPMIRTFVGHISSKRASPEQWGQMIRDLKNVMRMADQYEVDIAVEVHYDTFADQPASVLALAHQVNHPRLKIVFDGANLNVEQIDQMAALPELYPWVAHVHLKNYHWDHTQWYQSEPVPAFEGDIDNRALLNELNNRNYQGFVSLEYFGELKESNIVKSLNSWNG